MTIIIDLGSSAVKAGFALEDGTYRDSLCIYFAFIRPFGCAIARSFVCSVVRWLCRSVVRLFVTLFVSLPTDACHLSYCLSDHSQHGHKLYSHALLLWIKKMSKY